MPLTPLEHSIKHIVRKALPENYKLTTSRSSKKRFRIHISAELKDETTRQRMRTAAIKIGINPAGLFNYRIATILIDKGYLYPMLYNIEKQRYYRSKITINLADPNSLETIEAWVHNISLKHPWENGLYNQRHQKNLGTGERKPPSPK